MLALVLAVSLAADAKAEACVAKLGDTLAAIPECKDVGQALIDDEVDTFLAGGNSTLEKLLASMERSGKLTPLLARIQDAREYWRRNQKAPASLSDDSFKAEARARAKK